MTANRQPTHGRYSKYLWVPRLTGLHSAVRCATCQSVEDEIDTVAVLVARAIALAQAGPVLVPDNVVSLDSRRER